MSLRGRKINFRNPQEAKLNGIAMVFQNLSLIPDLTVWQNIVLGIEKKKKIFLDDREAMKLAGDIISDIKPDLDITKKVSELNPGEQQITEIAKAISVRPKLLILDEPTAALEQEEVRSLFRYMRKLAGEGVAMIFTSHRLGEVVEICDDIVVFRNGENVGYMNFATDGKDSDAIVKMITGEASSIHIAKEYHEIPEDYILQVEHLQYGKFLKDVSFNLRRGEVLGIGGLAGQGQTELMLALAGNYKQTAGTAKAGGKKDRLKQTGQRGEERHPPGTGGQAEGRIFSGKDHLLQYDLSENGAEKAAFVYAEKTVPTGGGVHLPGTFRPGYRHRCADEHSFGRQPAKNCGGEMAVL